MHVRLCRTPDVDSLMHAIHQRVGAIDCGTNAIRLLVADLSLTPNGPQLVDVHREERIVRLGEGIDATGRIGTGALDRTWRALADFAAIIRTSGAVGVRMVVTSAGRDAANRDEFVAMVRQTLGQDPEVISGMQEAELTFRGSVGDLAPAAGPFLVVDIGGGSTELVVGTVTGGEPVIDRAVSLDIGSVRITERLLKSDPPTAVELAAARHWAWDEITRGLNDVGLGSVRTMVAVSGSACTVAAAALGLATRDPARVHLARISVAAVSSTAAFLIYATRAHRAVLPYLHPGRVDVIGGGALLLDTIARMVAARTPITGVTVSEHDVLDGIALSLG